MFFRTRNWNIVAKFSLISTISYAIILAGIIALIAHHGLKLGLSFTGGTDVTVKYVQPVTREAVHDALATVGVKDATVNTIGKAGETAGERYTIETQVAFGDKTADLWSALNKVAHVDRAQSQIESVGPSLSHEYLTKALIALLIAIVIQFIYIAYRFDWNMIFGYVTVIALVRDSAMMIGIYAIADRRADDAFLAAVLTVIGYSVMDTIVILDRIRENTRVMRDEPYDKIVNSSILQTMTRSLNTLATVIVTLVALFALGGASLQNFAFALLVGICSGGYHSIFYSAPLVAKLRASQRRRERKAAVASAAAAAEISPEREAIIQARRERRANEKNQRVEAKRERYRRRRDVEFDPLDADRDGLHDAEWAMGHEEITMDLEEEASAADPAHHAEPPHHG
jgi:preprotein translocase subunit SecF